MVAHSIDHYKLCNRSISHGSTYLSVSKIGHTFLSPIWWYRWRVLFGFPMKILSFYIPFMHNWSLSIPLLFHWSWWWDGANELNRFRCYVMCKLECDCFQHFTIWWTRINKTSICLSFVLRRQIYSNLSDPWPHKHDFPMSASYCQQLADQSSQSLHVQLWVVAKSG